MPSGERKNRPFAITSEGRGFHCFSCGEKGNVIALVQKMERVEPKDAAKLVHGWFLQAPMPRPPVTPVLAKPEAAPTAERNVPLKEKWSKHGKPSDGRLKDLDYAHPYLQQRGFGPELCERFGVGVIRRGNVGPPRRLPDLQHGGGHLVAFCALGASRSDTGTARRSTTVSLDVDVGQSIVILGPSGCGKTTVLRLIAGLERPDVGEIRLDGRLVAQAGRNLVPPHERRLGYVFQDVALWPHLTVGENLDFVMGSAAVPQTERVKRTREILTLARIDTLADRHPHDLSGGEQQRAALARALVGRPQLLLLDEPFSSLDPDLRVVLRKEIDRLRRELRLTSIYVTHDREDATALADRIVEMYQGRNVAERHVTREDLRS